jgi:hypothetical protein
MKKDLIMTKAIPLPLVTGWDTVRYELLKTRICDMGLRIEGSILEPKVARIRREIAAKGLHFQPSFYLSDSWGCPDEVPAVGIPFYLADERLRRIEEEQTGEIEDDQMLLMLLRHEVGHAFNYAYRLWERPDWVEIFGPFSRPYRDQFQPNPASLDFVRHLVHSEYGRHYAQKHPDEDFAETFAVWLTPRSAWRRKYRVWPALRKLRYVDSLMRHLRARPPRRSRGKLVHPVEALTLLLADHYGQRVERYRAAAQGYVDDRLREVFPPVRGRPTIPAATLIHKHRDYLVGCISPWSGLSAADMGIILSKLEERAAALALELPRAAIGNKRMDIASLATALAMDFAYTGRFMG